MPFFYPTQNVGAYTDTMLGVAPIYWCWRAFGFLPDTAFQLWMLSASLLNYVSGYWLFRSGFRKSVLGSTAAAFLFAFGTADQPARASATLATNIRCRDADGALAILRIGRFPRHGRSRDWSVAGLGLVAQFYAAFYLGWFLMFALGLAACWGLILHLPSRNDHGLEGPVETNRRPCCCRASPCSRFLHTTSRRHRDGNAVSQRNLDLDSVLAPWIYMGDWNWIWAWTGRLPLFYDIGLNLESASAWASEWSRRLSVWPAWLSIGKIGPLDSPHSRSSGCWPVSPGSTASSWKVWPWVCGSSASSNFREGTLRRQTGGRWRSRYTPWPGPVPRGRAGYAFVTTSDLDPLEPALAKRPGDRGPGGHYRWLHFLSMFDIVWIPSNGSISGIPHGGDHRDKAIAHGPTPATRTHDNCRHHPGASVCLFGADVIWWVRVCELIPGARALRAVSRGLSSRWCLPHLVLLAFSTGYRMPGTTGLPLAAWRSSVWPSKVYPHRLMTSMPSDPRRRAGCAIDRRCKTFFFSPLYPLRAINHYHLDAMWAGLEADKPTINGYSGLGPLDWQGLYNGA